MHIDKISNLATFKQIKENWDAVYEADARSHFFLSWTWLLGWLPIVHESWFILAVKPDSESSYVAFFPLKILVQFESGSFKSSIGMVGNSMADYTGLICQPDYAESAIAVLAAYIKQDLSWSSLDLKSILATDSRISLFLRHFEDDNFKLNRVRIQSVDRQAPNNYIAPYISLPNTWDSYLQSHLSSNTRQKVRRFLRKVEQTREFRITQVNSENLEFQIEILLGFWSARWGNQMRDYDVVINYYRLILRHCFAAGCLYLPVLWQNDRPLGAIANFVDVQQKSMLFVIAGRDLTVKKPPSGLILHAHAIRHAIANGFKIYDFLMGDEEYKYSFGVKERNIRHVVIQNNSYHQQLEDIEQILSLALRHAVKYHRANQLNKAELGYRRILEVNANYSEALYGLAVLMRQQEKNRAAQELLEKLLQIQPNSLKAWFSLGNLFQSQGQLPEAIEAYNRVLKLQPEAIAAYNNLGYTLQQQGKWTEAIACYQKALELQPDCLEAEVNQANALYALGKLAPERQEHYALLNSNLGSRCRQLGDFKTAVAYYQQSLNLNPNLVETRENLNWLQEQTVVHT